MGRSSGETISKIVAGLGVCVALAGIIYDNLRSKSMHEAEPKSPASFTKSQPSESLDPIPRISCVVKLGGSACTKKDKFETFDSESVSSTAVQLQQLTTSGVQPLLIHGAGSFGHFQAREFEVSKGGVLVQRLREGFARTRISVLKLNNLIVDSLVQAGLPAVGISPGEALTTSDRGIQERSRNAAGFLQRLNQFVYSGFFPVIHGDACLDEERSCTILSGDALFVWFCREYRPDYGVFLTDVAGVFNKPPSESDAQLMSSIKVNSRGERTATSLSLTTDTRSHDVTGGIAAKLKVACQVAGELGIPVYIVKAGSAAAAQALRGERPAVGTTVERALE